jgi:hypothetical protein
MVAATTIVVTTSIVAATAIVSVTKKSATATTAATTTAAAAAAVLCLRGGRKSGRRQDQRCVDGSNFQHRNSPVSFVFHRHVWIFEATRNEFALILVNRKKVIIRVGPASDVRFSNRPSFILPNRRSERLRCTANVAVGSKAEVTLSRPPLSLALRKGVKTNAGGTQTSVSRGRFRGRLNPLFWPPSSRRMRIVS